MNTCGHNVIPAVTVDPNDIVCPSCHGNHLILEGFLQRPYAVTTKNGKTGNIQAPECKWQHDIKVIRCQSKKCGATHSIISDEMWELMKATSEKQIS